jgi:hypothetical protein
MEKAKCDGKFVEDTITRVLAENNVSRKNTVVDTVGLGSFVSSYVKGVTEFRADYKAINNKFANLKTECAYKLADMIKERKLYIKCTPEQRNTIEQELGALRMKNMNVDTSKKQIIGKDEMKKILMHSPDFLDMLLMRMYFELKTENSLMIYSMSD